MVVEAAVAANDDGGAHVCWLHRYFLIPDTVFILRIPTDLRSMLSPV